MASLNFYGGDGDQSEFTSFINYYGGDGNDLLFGTATANELYGGQGNDILKGGPFVSISGTGTSTADPLIYTIGLSGDDILEGGSGNDGAFGGDGNDKIFGGEGDDAGVVQGFSGFFFRSGLYGGDGNDEIYGGGGNDLLDSGAGTDKQYGGTGSDIFKFNLITDSAAGAARDVIVDFSKNEGDIIDLTAIDAKSGGADDAFKFIKKAGFHDQKGELRFSNHKVQGDVDGDGKADFEIGILGLNKMAKAEFDL